jgi:hypothetical protein
MILQNKGVKDASSMPILCIFKLVFKLEIEI